MVLKEGDIMATNTGKEYRKGYIRGEVQNNAPNGNPIKIDTKTGKIIDQKPHQEPTKV